MLFSIVIYHYLGLLMESGELFLSNSQPYLLGTGCPNIISRHFREPLDCLTSFF